jgi:hypothetical protein
MPRWAATSRRDLREATCRGRCTPQGARGPQLARLCAGQIAGVVGFSANGVGVAGITDSSSSFGGSFFGGLTVTGFKSAAVRHSDGSHRLLYAMESPQCWFEDFGRAKLVRGAARVMLDRDFAAVVRTDDYHVFLSPEGDSKGLYVSSRTRTGFQVREQDQGTGSVALSYRLVARRKDVAVQRFQKIELPAIQRAGLSKTPKAWCRAFKNTPLPGFLFRNDRYRNVLRRFDA